MSRHRSKETIKDSHKILALLVIILLVMGFYFNKTIAEIRTNHDVMQKCVQTSKRDYR